MSDEPAAIPQTSPGLDPEEEALAGTLPARDLALAPTVSGPTRTVVDPSTRTLTGEHPGRYERRTELGRGGMGRVVLAFDQHLGREVALKELLTQSPDAPAPAMSVGEVARFVREARVTGQLEHPSIVPVYELGQRADGSLYYTMQRIRGRSLMSALREAASLDDRLKLLVHFKHVCDAMAYAHARGVVHRDLKPDNVMVGEFGETLVVDWGLAKVRGERDTRAAEIERRVDVLRAPDAASTVDGHAMGTPAYMSPEQARGELDSIDERSDVWSLGAMLFELLTGRPPHTGTRAIEVLRKVLEERPPKVREVCPDAPADLAAVADRALSPNPASRYANAGQLAGEIDAFQAGRQVHAYEYSTLDLAKRFVSRHRAASLAALAVLVAVVASTLIAYRGYRSEAHARTIAESRRGEAEARAEGAREQESQARTAFAEALVGRAEHALDAGDPVAAAIYATHALEHDVRAPTDAASRRRHRERRARAESVYLDATHGPRARHVRDLPGASALGDLAPDGRTLVFPAGDDLVVLDLEADTRRVLEGVRAARVLGFLDDARVIVATAPPSVIALEDGRSLLTLPEGTSAASAREALAVTTRDGLLVVYDRSSLEELGRRELGERGAAHVAWVGAPEAPAIVTAHASSAAVLRHAWPLTTDPPARVELPAAPVAIAASPSGARVAVALGSAGLMVLDLARHATVGGASDPSSSGEPFVLSTLDTEGAAGALAWLGDERVIVAHGDDRAVLHPVSTGRPVLTLRTRPSSGGRVVAGGGVIVALPAPDARRLVSARVFRMERQRHRVTRHFDEAVQDVVHDPARGRLLVATPRHVSAHPLASRGLGPLAPILSVPPRHGLAVALAVAADGAVAISTSTGAVLVLEPAASAPILAFESGPVAPIAFDVAGEVLFAGGDGGAVRRWRRGGPGALEPLHAEGTDDVIVALAVSPDGAHLASATRDGAVRVWDLDRAASRRRHVLDDARATALAYDASGERLAIGDDRGRVTVLRARDGERQRRFDAHARAVLHVTFSAEGTRLATTAEDGTARVVSADGERVLRVVRTRGATRVALLSDQGRRLTFAEGTRLVHLDVGIPPRDAPATLRRAIQAHAGVRAIGLDVVAE